MFSFASSSRVAAPSSGVRSTRRLRRGGRRGSGKPIVASSSSPSGTKETYEGVYGDWSVTSEDEVEVLLYRVSVSAFAVGAIGVAGSQALKIDEWANASAGLSAAGLAGALLFVHMYLEGIKKAMQAMLGLGVLGGMFVAVTHPNGALNYFKNLFVCA